MPTDDHRSTSIMPGVEPGRIDAETKADRFQRIKRETEVSLEVVIRRALADGAEIDADGLARRVTATFDQAGFVLYRGAERDDRRASIEESDHAAVGRA